MPYVAVGASTGNYRSNALDDSYSASCEHYKFYNTDQNDIVNDLKPFSETKFDGSPLNRVVEQGAPGVDWQPHAGATDFNGHTVKMEYGTNISGEVLLLEVDNSGECKRNGYYQPNQLYKTISKDENWTTGGGKLHTTEEFKDKLGQVVLKRSYVTHKGSVVQVDTYYVYDDFGLLRFVIPPKAVELLKKGGSADATPANGYKVIEKSTNLHAAEANVNKYFVKQGASLTLQPGYHFKARSGHSLEIKSEQLNMTEFNELIYAYKYDGRKRMIYKKLPGAAPVYMVYDSRDRLVASQDGNQREKNQWLVSKYDVFNRVVLTALYIPELKSGGVKKNGEDLKEDVDKFYANTNNRMYESRSKNSQTYDNKSFPKDIQDGNILTKSYYGNYPNVSGIPNAYDAKWLANSEVLSEPKGQLTATWVKSMNADNGKNSGLWSVSFYDKKYRVVQTYVQNYLGGQDITSNEYDFVGKVKRSIRNHTASGNDITESKWFSYDHAGRMTKIEQAYSGSVTKSRATIAEMEYDELGQLKQKKLPVIDRDLDYAYNIRGWMTRMDARKSGNASVNFGFSLKYQQGAKELGGEDQYNGNIGATEWWSGLQKRQAYGYCYDALNRLKYANHRERVFIAISGPNTGGNSLEENNNQLENDDRESIVYNHEERPVWRKPMLNYTVDNITYDLNGNIKSLNRYGSGEQIDQLVYAYSGNQLSSVNDGGNDQIGFKELSDSQHEYTYDFNGNMKSDTNKGISKIRYNSLNLPENITKGSKTIAYTYSATGEKLENRLPDNKKLQYCGNFVYENGSLKYILNEEGKLNVGGGNQQYQFFVKDHLGNTRLAVAENGSIDELNHYYPFGMRMGMSSSKKDPDQKYLYNGKEMQEETDWLDYGARFYDASLGRWHCPDPMQQFASPYNYAGNDPINTIDPSGMWAYNTTYSRGSDEFNTIMRGIFGSNYSSSESSDDNSSTEPDKWKLNEQGGLEFQEKDNNDYLTFVDDQGDEIFRTDRQIGSKDKDDPKIFDKWTKMELVLRAIYNDDAAFSLMIKRADITGFNNSILKNGVDDLRFLGWKSYERIPGNIGFEALKIAIMGKVSVTTRLGNSLDANSIYTSLSKRNLCDDVKFQIINFVNDFKKYSSEISREWNSGLYQMQQSLKTYGTPY